MIFSKEMSNDFLEGNVEGFGILFCQKRFVEIKLIYSKKHTQTPYNPMDHHSDGRLDKARSTVFGCINLFILILSNLDHSDRCLLAWSTCKNFVKMSQLTFQRRCRYYGRLFINDFLNSLNRIQWAYHNGCACVWNVFSCEEAARGGHLEVLKWIKEKNCHWDFGTCEAAARGGHLEVLICLANGRKYSSIRRRSRPLHQGSWGLVLEFFVWEGPSMHSRKNNEQFQ